MPSQSKRHHPVKTPELWKTKKDNYYQSNMERRWRRSEKSICYGRASGRTYGNIGRMFKKKNLRFVAISADVSLLFVFTETYCVCTCTDLSEVDNAGKETHSTELLI